MLSVMPRGSVLLALSACFVCQTATLAHSAQSAPKPRRALHIRISAPLRHQVVVADQLVMVIDVPTAGHSPTERVDAINDRLVEIISTEPLLPSHMWIDTRHGSTSIMVGKHLLTGVTPADAHANQTTVPTLAHFWLANLKRALPQARPAPAQP